MYVLLSLTLALATVPVSYGQSGCPMSTQSKLMDCMGPLQAYLQATPDQKQALCGNARDSLQCIRDAVSECEAIEETPFQQMLQGFDLVEGDISSTCNEIIPEPIVTEAPAVATVASNEIMTCSKKDKKQLLRCSRKLQRFSAESPIRCGRIRKTMDCMTTLLETCRSSIKRKTVAKVESLRENLMGLCVETNEVDVDIDVTPPPVSEVKTTVRPPPVSAGCPPNPMSTINDCMAPIQSADPSQGTEAMCSVLRAGVICLDDLIERCQSEPGIDSVGQMMDQTRNLVRSQCPGSGPEIEIGEGNDECPVDVAERLQSCAEDNQISGGENQEESCRAMNNVLQCIDELIGQCGNIPEISALSSFMNLDNIRDIVSDHCSGKPFTPPETGGETNENCPSDYQQQLQACVEPMQTLDRSAVDTEQACRVGTDGLACLAQLLSDCGGKPEVRVIVSSLNMEEMRETLEDQCAPYLGGSNETNVGDENCPSDYQQQLQTCAGPIQALGQPSGYSEQVCRVASDGMTCVAQLVSDCGGKPEVRMIQNYLGDFQTMIEEQCAPYLGDGTDVGDDDCPANYAQGIMGCADSMDTISELQDMQLICTELQGSIDCVQGYIDKCGNKPDIMNLHKATGFDSLKNMVKSSCGSVGGGGDDNVDGSEDSCPAGYLLKLNDCANKMKAFSESGNTENKEMACSVARDGFGCLRQIFDDCSDKPEIQAFGDMFNLEEVHQMVEAQCSSDISMSNVIPSSSCKYEDPATKLLGCNRLLNKFNDESLKFRKRCRAVFKGFDCFDELVASCPDDTSVVKFTSLVNLDQARDALKDVCSA